jgi:hypothetical protein
VAYTNAFFTSGVAQPVIILEDQTGFVTRDRNFIFPIESQVIGKITSDFYSSPFSYSLDLPAVPDGALHDVDNDGAADVVVADASAGVAEGVEAAGAGVGSAGGIGLCREQAEASIPIASVRSSIRRRRDVMVVPLRYAASRRAGGTAQARGACPWQYRDPHLFPQHAERPDFANRPCYTEYEPLRTRPGQVASRRRTAHPGAHHGTGPRAEAGSEERG